MIELEHVTKQYNGTKALEDVSFKIGPGEFICLVGPSGAGKSTLIKLLTREQEPSSGKITVANRDINKLSGRQIPFYRRKVGIVFQDYRLIPTKTVYENIAFALEVCEESQWEIERRVPKILELVGMADKINNYPAELSGGEQQRVSIARALVHLPRILIADEPTGNLDPVNTWEIIELLNRINRKGTIVILATHDKSIVDRLRKRLIILRKGKLLAERQGGWPK